MTSLRERIATMIAETARGFQETSDITASECMELADDVIRQVREDVEAARSLRELHPLLVMSSDGAVATFGEHRDVERFEVVKTDERGWPVEVIDHELCVGPGVVVTAKITGEGST